MEEKAKRDCMKGKVVFVLTVFLSKLILSVQRHVQMAWPSHLCGTWRMRDTSHCLVTVSLDPLDWG